ncbi:hypothetical protein L1S35_05165 [Flavobacterium sp. AS60]|uniref:hypothetical protein n=1 Tax=Flavobacterium anseongense TaxID=2910677 RepID=UPI001F21D4F5|nr:hypothetical protein [Flavobacterium sp. AS60]MCF6129054.1 hypothetical protein [Flavobacterium sp. AS60]
MQKKSRNIIIAILALLSLKSYAQIDQFKLADSLLIKRNPKIIILNQNEKFVVLTTRKLYIEQCKDMNNAAGPFDELLEYIQKNKSSSLDISIKEDFEGLNNEAFQSLLLRGKCLVYNKLSKKLEKKVFENYYKPNDLSLEYKTESGFIVLIKIEYER